MKYLKHFLVIHAMILLVATSASAGDFDWLKELNLQVKADESGFKTRLETRFNVGDVEVKAVLGDVDKPADAYMVLRLGELSGRPVNDVLKVYKKSRGKGWGVIAKSLGIKPGSRAFHALKAGHDLDGARSEKKDKGKKEKGRGKGRN